MDGWAVVSRVFRTVEELAQHVRVPTLKSPLLLAGALVRDDAGRFLLIHRNTPSGTWWEVPGGKVEAGEALWDAAARELSEELNAEVEPITEIGTGEFRSDGRVYRYTWYAARLVGGQPEVVETHLFDDIRYFSLGEAAHLPDPSPSLRRLFELHADRLDALQAGTSAGSGSWTAQAGGMDSCPVQEHVEGSGIARTPSGRSEWSTASPHRRANESRRGSGLR